MQPYLSPRELARVIGASESSLKRWADDGHLEVARTSGGHRRIALREALRFIRQSRLTVVDPQPLGIAESIPLQRGRSPDGDLALQQAILTGQAQEARGLVLAMYLAGRAVAEICDGPLTQAMHEVGLLWKHGPHGIHTEHAATDLCAQTLYYLRALLPPPKPDAPLALGGALPSDPYMLPSLMVATTLGSLGWRELNLGPNLPFNALLAAVDAHHPALVWLACSIPNLPEQHARELRKTTHKLAECGVQLLVGGRGWLLDFLADPTVQPLRFCHTMRELTAFVEGLRVGG